MYPLHSLALFLLLYVQIYAQRSQSFLPFSFVSYIIRLSCLLQCSQQLLLRSLENKRRLFSHTNIMAQNHTWRFGRQRWWGESAWVGGGEPRPTSSEKASYQAAFERLHEGGFPSARVSKQLQFDPGLWILCVPQLLDKNPPVRILKFNTKEKSECVAGNFCPPTNSTWGLDTLSCQTAEVWFIMQAISYWAGRQESLMLTLKSCLDISLKSHVFRLKSVDRIILTSNGEGRGVKTSLFQCPFS